MRFRNCAAAVGFALVAAICLAAPVQAADGTVTTFAGPDFVEAGEPKNLDTPNAVAVHADGNVYVADTGKNRILKVTPSGQIATFAPSAGFAGPRGVAVDGSGFVYVADTNNGTIRKISPSGVVSTLAGSATSGYKDGRGSAAEFSVLSGIAVDGSGNVFVTDQGNQRIRKVSPDGEVTTFAGSGTPGFADGLSADAKFQNPFGIAVDANGTVYVADSGNHRIRTIANGRVDTLAGTGADGHADGDRQSATFYGTYGVTTDGSGNVYVADSFNHLIRKIDPSGHVSTVAGSTQGFKNGVTGESQFNLPTGVAVDAGGNLYVADSFNHQIRKIEGVSAGASMLRPAPTLVAIASAGLVVVVQRRRRSRACQVVRRV